MPRSGVFCYVQWACSGPVLWWMMWQLLATLPPSALVMPNIKRVAAVELALAWAGLALALAVESPLGA